MPEEIQERKRVCLMGPLRVLSGVDGPEVSLEGGERELLALLIVGTLLLRPDGVWREIRDSQGHAGYEVRREWLVEALFPNGYIPKERPDAGRTIDPPQAARDRVGYLLNRLHPRGASDPPLSFRLLPDGESRERGVARVTWRHLDIDVAETLEAAQNPHGTASQKTIMGKASRPLLAGAPYAWLQRSDFRRARAKLDALYLAALCGQADSFLVLMENARTDGKADLVYSWRSKALPLLDRVAERLHGAADGLDARELAELRPFPKMLEGLRARASYPVPEEEEAGGEQEAEERVDAAPPPAHNLPSPVTSFVGRTQEQADINEGLKRGRLVTLTGMGGCGKTRLAVQTAWELLRDWEGVRLVELAALADSDRVPQAVATALGVAEQKGVTVTEALIAFLQGKRTLLLLDNCEHLLLDDRSGKDDCGTFAATLLHACPTLSIMATSRKPLNIDGEQLCPLSPLPFPAPDFLPPNAPDPVATLLGYDAAQLFVDRVFQFRRSPLDPENVGSVAAICAALDGIPLSLELAAARIRALSLEEITKRLSDSFGLLTHGRRESPARHKTLRAVIDWSYDLLNEPERLLLCRLSVFAGGWTLDAAEAVGASQNAAASPVLDLLTSLVDKSLVVFEATSGRYRMLETVRQYAQDRLRECGERERTRRAHRKFYFHLAEAAYQNFKEADQKQWLDRLAADADNLRATIASYSEARDADEEWLRFTSWLWHFWWLRGHLHEALSQLQEALAQAKDASGPTRALALEGAGNLKYHLGDYQSARVLLDQGLMLMCGSGDEKGVARVANSLGALAMGIQDIAEAQTQFERALEIFRRISDTHRIPIALVNLGTVAYHRKNYSQARALFSECLELFREVKDEHHLAHSLYCLGNVEQDEGNTGEAQRLLKESLKIYRDWKDQWHCIALLETLTSLAAAKGQHQRAGKLWGAAQAGRQQLESPLQPDYLAQYGQILSEVRAALGTEAYEAALAEGGAMTWEQAVAFALGEDAA